ACLNCNRLRRPTVVSEARRVEHRVGVAQRTVQTTEAARSIVSEGMTAILWRAGTVPALGAARHNRVRKFCFASRIAVEAAKVSVIDDPTSRGTVPRKGTIGYQESARVIDCAAGSRAGVAREGAISH